MSFSLSPAVITREIDLSAVMGAAPSSLGAFAGMFHWGPVNQPMLISDEPDLVKKFGYPDNDNAVDFFVMASFFGYTSGAWVTRIGNHDMTNARWPAGNDTTILNDYEFEQLSGNLSDISLVARYPGQVGNVLGVSVCSTKKQYNFTFKATNPDDEDVGNLTFNFIDPATNKGIKSKELPVTGKPSEYVQAGDYLIIDSVKYTVVNVTDNVDSNGDDVGTIEIDRLYVGKSEPAEIARYWKYYDEFNGPPVKDTEFHLIITDELGYFKQVGSVLESFPFLSLDVDAVDAQNQNSYWENVINKKSNYVFAGEATPVELSNNNSVSARLEGGNNAQATIGLDEKIKGWELYLNSETYDTPLLIGGNAITSNDSTGAVLANYIIHSIAEIRKDSLAFVSPPLEAVLNNKGKEALSCVKARKLLGSSSYGTMDGNWKYMYDKYNDTFRWVPCSGDHAGLYAQNDRNRDPWVSAAGTSKGRLKNVVKFAWNPDKTQRDLLYPNDVNPIFNMSIAGPVLFGDKTLLGKNTALSRNNVRRLLIVLEKTISTAAVDLLFEFNDEFTQRRFVSMVKPFLQDAKGRRGLTAFKVIADETVNTPQVVQNNSFVGQIYIKPNYTISDIRLDFVVVNASATFEEVIGSY